MRFERLHLLRYGSLSDCTLTFRPDAKLHIVYGPNEAGKSSALAAVSDLLFGFPHGKAFDFRHDASALRVGATLRTRDGGALSFRRRRGNKATLLADDDDETALREDALAPFVGSLSRDVFERAFGLNAERLRTGADEMLSSDGEIGGLLFAAASGVMGLTQLRGALEDEASRIFAPRASQQRLFYQIAARHDEARRAERESELRAGDWKALNATIAELEENHETLAEMRLSARQTISRLQRLQQLRPIVAEIDACERQLSGYADLASLPVDFAVDLAAVLDDIEDADKALKTAQDNLESAEAALGGINVDEALLGEVESISALFAQSGDHAAKLQDLPRIEAERDDYTGQLKELADRLGVANADLERSQPSDAVLVRIRKLVDEARRYTDGLAALDSRLAEERQTLAGLDAEQTSGHLVDPKPWRLRMSAFTADLRALDRRDELQTQCRGEHRRIAESAQRLTPPVEDFDRLATAQLPSAETLIRQRDGLARFDAELDSLRGRLVENEAAIARLEAAIAESERGGPVPSREAISEVRRARDEEFEPLAAALLGTKLPFPPETAAGEVARFRALSGDADTLADQALDDAARVHAHASQHAEKARLQNARADLEGRAAALEAERGRALDIYRDPFRALDIEPTHPDEMIAWVRNVAALQEGRRAVLERGDEVAALNDLAERIRPALDEMAGGLQVDAPETLPVAVLARALDARLDELGELWSDSRARVAVRRETEERLMRLAGERERAAELASRCRDRFAEAVVEIGLDGDASPDQVTAVLLLWERLPGLRRERDNRARRVAGMKRDVNHFEEKLSALLAAVAQDLAELPPTHAVKVLNDRAEAVRIASAQRRDAAAALEDAEQKVARLKEELDARITARDHHLAGCPEDTDPAALLKRLEERDRLSDELKACRRRLSEVAVDVDEDRLHQDLENFDPERAVMDIEASRQEEERVDGEMSEVFANLSAKRREREHLDTAAGAERAAFARNAAEVEIIEVARQWVVLKLASTLLSAALELHRDDQDDPVLRSAAQLFSGLTKGGFASLGQEYDEDDRLRLVGIRDTGERVGIAGLSDGTRDQLYLALRLAFLEDYGCRNEPAPFIGDDIFLTFDDERTAAGLQALADLSECFQSMLFTHHRSVVEAAREVLGADADIVEI
jgi:uncharacterized protein YhaN